MRLTALSWGADALKLATHRHMTPTVALPHWIRADQAHFRLVSWPGHWSAGSRRPDLRALRLRDDVLRIAPFVISQSALLPPGSIPFGSTTMGPATRAAAIRI